MNTTELKLTNETAGRKTEHNRDKMRYFKKKRERGNNTYELDKKLNRQRYNWLRRKN